MDLISQLDQFEATALWEVSEAVDLKTLEVVRVKYLGARHGRIKEFQVLLGTAPKEQKPLLGKRFNEVKSKVTLALDERKRKLERPAVAAGGLDVTLPGPLPPFGRRHPLMQTILEFKDIMGRFGFTVADGPEVEDEYHNF